MIYLFINNEKGVCFMATIQEIERLYGQERVEELRKSANQSPLFKKQ